MINLIFIFIPYLFITYFIFKYFKVFLSGNEPNDFMKKNIGSYRRFFEQDNIKHFYYYRVKPESNKLIVAVPGFGGSVDSYKSFFNQFEDFNFLTIDFYGRGWTSGINKNYKLSLFSEHLDLFIKNIPNYNKIDEIVFIGTSMGCLIIDDYIRNNLYNTKLNLKNVVFICPAGRLAYLPFVFWLLKKPVIGEFLTSLFGNLFLKHFNSKCSNKPSNDYFYFLKHHRGYLKSLLSTIRNVKFDNYKYLDYDNLLVINTKIDKIVKLSPSSFENSKKYYFEDKGHSELIQPSIEIIKKFIT